MVKWPRRPAVVEHACRLGVGGLHGARKDNAGIGTNGPEAAGDVSRYRDSSSVVAGAPGSDCAARPCAGCLRVLQQSQSGKFGGEESLKSSQEAAPRRESPAVRSHRQAPDEAVGACGVMSGVAQRFCAFCRAVLVVEFECCQGGNRRAGWIACYVPPPQSGIALKPPSPVKHSRRPGVNCPCRVRRLAGRFWAER